jgi:hypothetical protein
MGALFLISTEAGGITSIIVDCDIGDVMDTVKKCNGCHRAYFAEIIRLISVTVAQSEWTNDFKTGRTHPLLVQPYHKLLA